MDQYFNGAATIISKLKTVSLVVSLMGPKLSVSILSFSKKKWSISGKHLLIANTPNGLWTRWRKDLQGQPVRSLMGLTSRTPQAPSLLPMKLKPRVIW